MKEIDADGDAAAARWLPVDKFFDDLAINPFTGAQAAHDARLKEVEELPVRISQVMDRTL
jgi:hypothetical protein